METVIQKYLRNEFNDIDRMAEAIAEQLPYTSIKALQLGGNRLGPQGGRHPPRIWGRGARRAASVTPCAVRHAPYAVRHTGDGH